MPSICFILNNLEVLKLESFLRFNSHLSILRPCPMQLLSIDQKWVGAPFAAMLRRHQSDYSYTNDDTLRVVVVLLPSNSNVKQVKYSSLVLQVREEAELLLFEHVLLGYCIYFCLLAKCLMKTDDTIY